MNEEGLYRQQEQCLKNFQESHLLKILSSTELDKKENRNKILDCIQIFANYFQKIVMLRGVFTHNPVLSAIARMHLNEELGHDAILVKERNNKDTVFDPILDSAMAWFCWQMFGLNDLEKTVLMHWVLESSAYCFFTKAKTVFDRYGEMAYFQIHSEADEEHKDIAPALLNNLRPEEYARLEAILVQGWSVMTTACDHIAELVGAQS
jgi:hypothetical protein